MQQNSKKGIMLPELLSPAGSMDAFRAAIDGGADAIYIGGSAFNARINAKNFTDEELSECVKLAHAYGIKVYQTLNIMVYDRELDDLVRAAEQSAKLGIDAFIVSDLGAAHLINSYLPEIPLHASTQMSIHNAAGAMKLYDMGFSRVVPARELSSSDIAAMVKEQPLEVEIFVHGALCVSHSGQCLFSSLVGGRSGNRGLCAQPCRLPYACGTRVVRDRHPLSLKDLSLAAHVREIIDSGVASLKIEGRMKSPEYVRGVTRIWRNLLDEGKNADKNDINELAELFSRGGFTDSYYKKTVGRPMLGVRSESDKQASRDIEKFNKITRKIPIDMSLTLNAGQLSSLTLTLGSDSITVTGDKVQKAINAPLDHDAVKKCMSKLGDTPFVLSKLEFNANTSVMMPISALNALRRRGTESLLDKITEQRPVSVAEKKEKICRYLPKKQRVARFYSPDAITAKAREYFDIILLPLDRYIENAERSDGFVMPPVMFDFERERISEQLISAAKFKPLCVVITNIGQMDEIKNIMPEAELIADFRFNIGNTQTAAVLEDMGFGSYVASAELTLPQLRDLKGAKAATVYGRLPLMTLEKCVIKELYGDKQGCAICSEGKAQMTDRRGFVFPILRENEHRNVVYNSLPTCMSDRKNDLDRAGITDMHFIFTTESPDEVDEVISAFCAQTALDKKVRRI